MAKVSFKYVSKLPLFLPGAMSLLALASPNCKDDNGSGGNAATTSGSATSGATTTGSSATTGAATTTGATSSAASAGSTSATSSSTASGMIQCGGGDGGPTFCNTNQCCVSAQCFNSSEQPSNAPCAADEQCASCKCDIISDAGFLDGGPGICK